MATPASAATAAPRRTRAPTDRAATALSVGIVTLFLSILVVLPIAALVWEARSEGSQTFWDAVSSPEAVAALKLTLIASLLVSLFNAVLGTVTAWVLVRDEFRGKTVVNAIIDLPFALPTIVAGLTLLALYGPRSPIGINVAYTQTAIVLCMMFVTLPFVVRTVQPVLQELDPETVVARMAKIPEKTVSVQNDMRASTNEARSPSAAENARWSQTPSGSRIDALHDHFDLRLTDADVADLVEYLKSL